LSDTCVFLDLGADFAWTKTHKDLCIFLGGVQKLPAGRACECPLLTENWYLQWGIEMGFTGLILCIAIILLTLVYSFRVMMDDAHSIPALALLGIAVGGVFLHSFEDAAVAYTLWLLLGACVRAGTRFRPVV
jgi:hypothetical protein